MDKASVKTFDGFQYESGKTAIYPGVGTLDGLRYVTLGLSEECGEVAGKIKRIFRDDGAVLTTARRKQLIYELGDVLWYLQQMATELEVPLSLIAELNVHKLQERLAQGRLHGEGDLR